MSADSGAAKALRVPVVAKRLDVSVNTVYRLLRSGQLVGRRLGGTKAGWRVTEAALAAFLAAPTPHRAAVVAGGSSPKRGRLAV